MFVLAFIFSAAILLLDDAVAMGDQRSAMGRPVQKVPPLACAPGDHPGDCTAMSSIFVSMQVAATRATLPWKNGSKVCSREYVTCDGEGYVTMLDLHNLGLVGTIPADIANFQRLQKLFLFANELHGEIIPEVCLLRETLTDLILSENLFAGSIPPCIGTMVKLQYIGFAYNKLVGSIPASLET